MESMNRIMQDTAVLRQRARLLLLYALFTAIAMNPVSAQSFSEWFKQKKTQKKYLQQQIAALFTYGRYVRDGYDVARKGLGTISSFTKGELTLHEAFFASLKTASPLLRNHGKVAEIIAMQLAIAGRIKDMVNGNLTSNDREYVATVRSKLISECGKDLDELLLLITTGHVEMSDEERLARLDKVYQGTIEKWSFFNKWKGDVEAVSLIRKLEQESIKHIRRLYGKE